MTRMKKVSKKVGPHHIDFFQELCPNQLLNEIPCKELLISRMLHVITCYILM